MKQKLFFSLLAILFSGGLFAQEKQTFTKDNIRFEMPVEWLIRSMPSFYILVSEPSSSELQVLTTFDVEMDSTFSNLDSFCVDYENGLRKSTVYSDLVILNKEKVDFHGMVATEYHCTATAFNLPMEWKSIVFVKNNRVYKLSTASLIGMFMLKSATTDAIFNSFEID